MVNADGSKDTGHTEPEFTIAITSAGGTYQVQLAGQPDSERFIGQSNVVLSAAMRTPRSQSSQSSRQGLPLSS